MYKLFGSIYCRAVVLIGFHNIETIVIKRQLWVVSKKINKKQKNYSTFPECMRGVVRNYL